MKNLGRILIILAAFAIVMGVTYVVVNAGTSVLSRSGLAFGRTPENPPRFEGERREVRGAVRPIRLIAELIKNVGIVAVIVALITVPKSLKKRKDVPITTNKK
ncbi:MAG TPA: hypothetical protein VK249_10605 [Anaerolineales bacterium]|nr:hypothetical protein [Anaerolineales bacterium]